MSWPKGTLKDLVFFQRGFDITKAQQEPGSIPVISSSGIKSFHSTAKAEGPGVVIGRKGTLGSVHYSENEYWPHDTTLWSKDLRGNNSKYVYYFLKTLHLEKYDVGNSNPTLNRNHIHRLEITIPPLPVQNDIANILSTYDDLIENNRRRIALLNQTPRLLFTEWFGNFRFPGAEYVKFTKGIPASWEVRKLGEILKIESGSRPKGGAYNGDGIPSVGAENIIGIGQYDYTKEKYVPHEYFNNMRRGIVNDRDVLLYKDGANIGRSSYFGEGFPHEECAINEHVFILRSTADLNQNYLYFWIEREETRQRIANLNSNCAQPGISQEKLKGISIVVPERTIIELFNDAVEPIVKQIFILGKYNRKLALTRDILLPRLMNGEITV